METIIYREQYPVERGGFAAAGDASSQIKRTLKRMGVDPGVIREVAIAAYELELNLVIHSDGGSLILEFMQDKLRLVSTDDGPGIPDLSLAMKEGYSTASEEVRSMGFGAGMGLPNVKRHSHEFDIQSTPGVGTTTTALYHLKK